ncbi:helix-turn-helix domain-containing protein [Desulfatitalea alkaliphila]|uniref:Helix-turn-helix domain-containing protein n=1 Tax=Desulfatitalea alkaliphila TaxID=2929485 RepID=A0AA41R0D4_9BACT|nr:helix-turn-helix domain-containing protein [Desulfatitalea alkaliphila]MCJ8499683.1 helix-turn-helix domain-containing protein [Desulfatitalea alkaliphila]
MAVKISKDKILQIGPIVHFHRKLAKLSRVDLSNIAGVGKTVVYDIENGKETVRLNTLCKVLEALNISISLESPLMDRYKAEDDAQS